MRKGLVEGRDRCPEILRPPFLRANGQKPPPVLLNGVINIPRKQKLGPLAAGFRRQPGRRQNDLANAADAWQRLSLMASGYKTKNDRLEADGRAMVLPGGVRMMFSPPACRARRKRSRARGNSSSTTIEQSCQPRKR